MATKPRKTEADVLIGLARRIDAAMWDVLTTAHTAPNELLQRFSHEEIRRALYLYDEALRSAFAPIEADRLIATSAMRRSMQDALIVAVL